MWAHMMEWEHEEYHSPAERAKRLSAWRERFGKLSKEELLRIATWEAEEGSDASDKKDVAAELLQGVPPFEVTFEETTWGQMVSPCRREYTVVAVRLSWTGSMAIKKESIVAVGDDEFHIRIGW